MRVFARTSSSIVISITALRDESLPRQPLARKPSSSDSAASRSLEEMRPKPGRLDSRLGESQDPSLSRKATVPLRLGIAGVDNQRPESERTLLRLSIPLALRCRALLSKNGPPYRDEPSQHTSMLARRVGRLGAGWLVTGNHAKSQQRTRSAGASQGRLSRPRWFMATFTCTPRATLAAPGVWRCLRRGNCLRGRWCLWRGSASSSRSASWRL